LLRMTAVADLLPIFPGVDIDRAFWKRKLCHALAVLQDNRFRAGFVAECEQFLKKRTIENSRNTDSVRTA
jgi:hypothetical protein